MNRERPISLSAVAFIREPLATCSPPYVTSAVSAANPALMESTSAKTTNSQTTANSTAVFDLYPGVKDYVAGKQVTPAEGSSRGGRQHRDVPTQQHQNRPDR